MLSGELTKALNPIRPENIRVQTKPRAGARRKLWEAKVRAGICYVRVDVSDEYMPSYSSSGDDTSSAGTSADEDEAEDEQLKEAVRVVTPAR